MHDNAHRRGDIERAIFIDHFFYEKEGVANQY